MIKETVASAERRENGIQDVRFTNGGGLSVPPLEYTIQPGDVIRAKLRTKGSFLLERMVVGLRVNDGPIIDASALWAQFDKEHGQ